MEQEYIETEEFDADMEESCNDVEDCSNYVNTVIDNIQDSLED